MKSFVIILVSQWYYGAIELIDVWMKLKLNRFYVKVERAGIYNEKNQAKIDKTFDTWTVNVEI